MFSFYQACSYCFNKITNLVPCDKCSYAIYCSDECKHKDKNHDQECSKNDIQLKLDQLANKITSMDLEYIIILQRYLQHGYFLDDYLHIIMVIKHDILEDLLKNFNVKKLLSLIKTIPNDDKEVYIPDHIKKLKTIHRQFLHIFYMDNDVIYERYLGLTDDGVFSYQIYSNLCQQIRLLDKVQIKSIFSNKKENERLKARWWIETAHKLLYVMDDNMSNIERFVKCCEIICMKIGEPIPKNVTYLFLNGYDVIYSSKNIKIKFTSKFLRSFKKSYKKFVRNNNFNISDSVKNL